MSGARAGSRHYIEAVQHSYVPAKSSPGQKREVAGQGHLHPPLRVRMHPLRARSPLSLCFRSASALRPPCAHSASALRPPAASALRLHRARFPQHPTAAHSPPPQVPLAAVGAVMMYDEKRVFNRMLQPEEQPAYDAVRVGSETWMGPPRGDVGGFARVC